MKSNSMDQEAAKAAAKRLYQKVNFSGGALQSYQISSLLTDTYEYLKIPFKPTTSDIKNYTLVLDANRDGQVTLADLETIATQYLCGSGIVSNQSSNPNIKKQTFEVSGVSSSSYNASYHQPITTSEKIMGVSNGTNWQQPAANFDQKPLSNPSSTPQQEYNQQTLHYLSITKQIFEHHADQHYTITSDRVVNLLSETYQVLGRKGYKPSEQDVKVWMRLCDSNGDGHVEYHQYSYFVICSLERSGYQIYK